MFGVTNNPSFYYGLQLGASYQHYADAVHRKSEIWDAPLQAGAALRVASLALQKIDRKIPKTLERGYCLLVLALAVISSLNSLNPRSQYRPWAKFLNSLGSGLDTAICCVSLVCLTVQGRYALVAES